MRRVVVGAIVGASLVIGGFGLTSRSTITAETGQPSRDLITFSMPGDKGQHLVVIDPGQRVMAVYYVDSQAGKVALRSVRQFHWDLQIADFNGEKPLPREIRQMLEQK